MESSALLYSILSGAALGWVAIPHCYAMCGPLHMGLCALNRERAINSISLFNVGRLLGYTLTGILFGYLGTFLNKFQGIPTLAYLFPALIMLLISFFSFKKKGLSIPGIRWIQNLFRPDKGLVLFGSCTALIPCGMLYMAFSGALATASPLSGALFMFSFAFVQTFFMQMGVVVGRMMDKKWGLLFERVFPWLSLGLAIFYGILFLKHLNLSHNHHGLHL